MAVVTENPKASAALSNEEILRYSRHLIMPEVGMEGQQKLKAARVLCIGAGGLGSPLLLYLAAAGVGHLGIIDDDSVEISNLQRQILYGTSQTGQKKVDAAKNRLEDLNPHIDYQVYSDRLSETNAFERIQQYDIVVDGSDNFQTR